MAITYQQLPVNNEHKNVKFTSTINGTTYKFYVFYSSRADKWYINISGIDDTIYFAGVPVLANSELLTAVQSDIIDSSLFALYVNIK